MPDFPGDWENPFPHKVPYHDIAKVRNVLGEWKLVVFAALPQQQDIKVVLFRHIMCMN